MRLLLDSFFSSIIIYLSFFAVLFVIILLLKIFKKPANNNAFKIILSIFLFIMIFIIPTINLNFFGYGYAKNISRISLDKNRLCLIDKNYSFGTDEDDYYRLYAVNPENGKIDYRKIINEYNNYFLHKDNLIFYGKYNTMHLFDLSKRKVIKRFNKNNLIKQYKELSNGIADFAYDTNFEMIKVTNKLGITYFIDPFSNIIISGNPEKFNKKENFYVQSGQIYKNTSNGVTFISLDNDEWNNKILFPENHELKIKNIKLKFLEGFILAVFEDCKSFLVLSYETTDKADFILHCISFDLNPIWQIKQEDLNAKDFFNKGLTLNSYCQYKNNLIFNVGGFVYSINVENGRINWKTRF